MWHWKYSCAWIHDILKYIKIENCYFKLHKVAKTIQYFDQIYSASMRKINSIKKHKKSYDLNLWAEVLNEALFYLIIINYFR